jgi:uncharacterized heparinase superfamily protein
MDVFAALENDGKKLSSKAYHDSGLYVMREADRYLLASCGGVSRARTRHHKHNDLLGFELYAGDKAFIVDPGAYVYTRNPDWRNLFRSTHYHNTVVIDGQEQNRFEASELFEMTADSSVIVNDWVNTSKKDWLDVQHTGYARLAQPVQHRRTFLFDKHAGTWTITDILTGAGNHRAEWYFHFDHGINLKQVGALTFRTNSKGINLEISAHSEIPLTFDIADGWVSRQYGRKLPAQILYIRGKFDLRCRAQLSLYTV